MSEAKQFEVGALLFPDFELLDIFGPLEMLGLLDKHHGVNISMIAQTSGEVRSAQGPQVVANVAFPNAPKLNLLIVPGGWGTREQIKNPELFQFLKTQSASADFVASVCTGSALLARAGVLDGRKATSNKLVFDWVTTQGQRVEWVRKARWVQDGKFFTSSGVSAGMDMTLGLIEQVFGRDAAILCARRAEYIWNENRDTDPFA